MWTVVEYVSFFIIVFWLVKHAWPSRPNPRDQKREEDRKHGELISAIESIRRPEKKAALPAPAQPVGEVDAGMMDNGMPYTRYSDDSVEVDYPEGRVRYYNDGSVETETPAGPVRLRTATEMLNFMTQSQSASGQKTT